MKLAWGAKVSPEFRRRTQEIATALDCDPSQLMACMAFETGQTFRADIRNAAGSGATGLIQFMPRTAIDMGTSVDELARLTPEEQLLRVYQYLKPYAGLMHSLADLYMAILMPTAIKKPDNAVLITDAEGKAYIQNKGLDLNQDGNITKIEAASLVQKQYDLGMQPGNVWETETQPAAPIGDQPTTTPQEKPMGALALFQMFAGPLMQLIPQITPIIKASQAPATQTKTDAYAQLAETILNVILEKTKQPNLPAAIGAMQEPVAGKELTTEVQQAVVSHPDVIQFMEVGGGFAAARAADLKQQELAQAPDAKPFWETSAVFWISLILLPMIYWYVGSSIAGGITIPENWPWYAQLPLKMLGIAWDSGARVGLANLIVGLVLGGICGVYYGISVTQQKQSSTSTGSSDSGH